MCDPNNGNEIYDLNKMRFVGWESLTKNIPAIQYLSSPELVGNISAKITELLQGVHPEGRDIVVADYRIGEVISDIYTKTMPLEMGDIYTKETIPQEVPSVFFYNSIIERTIEVITSSIRNEFEMIEENNKLSIWNTIYGNFNEKGLRGHAPIKIRKKHPQYMAFNMNY